MSIENRQITWIDSAFIQQHGFRGLGPFFPVSYTHLDVYKRQEEYNARHVELEPCDCQLEYLLG